MASELITAPLDTVQRLYKESGSQHGTGTGNKFNASSFFADALRAGTLAQQVPWIVLDSAISAPTSTLVQTTCMVQDMLDPEFYFGAIKQPDGSWATAKYGAEVAVPDNAQLTSEQASIWERRPLQCVPVPGLSAWATADQGGSGSAPSAGHEQKAAVCKTGSATDALHEQQGCTVYVYDAPDTVRLHDVIHVFGVLSYAPCAPGRTPLAPAEEGPEGEEEEGSDIARQHTCDQHNTAKLPQVPVIHALILTHAPSLAPAATRALNESTNATQVEAARTAALSLLTDCLGGDALAAEYVLLAALAKVTSRVPGTGAVGALPLSLTRCPGAAPVPKHGGSAFGAALRTALAALLPAVAYRPLSVPALNAEGGWMPRRDPDTGRVSGSPLALPAGCVLLVDETCLGEGKLAETGIHSLQALQGVLQDQVLVYDFEYSRHPVPVNLPVIVVSEAKPLLHADLPVSLPLKTTQPTLDAAQVQARVDALAAQGKLDAVRAYLAVAMQVQYELTEQMVNQLQNEFVASRKLDPGFSAEGFQRRLTLGRLMAVSWGEAQLNSSRWQDVLRLETARQARNA